MVADQAYHFSFIFEDSLEKCLDSLHNKLIMWKPKSCPKALNLIGRLFFFCRKINKFTLFGYVYEQAEPYGF